MAKKIDLKELNEKYNARLSKGVGPNGNRAIMVDGDSTEYFLEQGFRPWEDLAKVINKYS